MESSQDSIGGESGDRHLLRAIRLFRGLTAQQLLAVEGLGRCEALPLGSVLVARGAPAEQVFGVLQGTVACVGTDGEEIITLGPGAMVPLLALTPLRLAEATWRAATAGEAFVVPREPLLDLLGRPPGAGDFWREALPAELADQYLAVLLQAEEARKDARRQWRQSHRMELRWARRELLASLREAALEELVVTTVHHASNALAGALGFAQLLQRRALPPEARQELGIVEHEAQRVVEVLRRLRGWVPRRGSDRQEISLALVLGRALELQGEELEGRGLELAPRLDGDLPPLQGDPHRLLQAILALLLGAGEVFTPAEGRGALLITAQGVQDHIEVRVSCPGRPAPPGELQALLDPLAGGPRSRSLGTLELHLCQRIAREHGGDLRAEPEGEGGIALVLALPRLAASP